MTGWIAPVNIEAGDTITIDLSTSEIIKVERVVYQKEEEVPTPRSHGEITGIEVPDGYRGKGMNTSEKHVFTSGATSSGRKPRYDLIPTWALERIARRFELGAEKYGVDNWQQGLRDREFIFDRINHAIEHLLLIRDRMRGPNVPPPLALIDDDAAGVVLNAIFVMGYERTTEQDREARTGATQGLAQETIGNINRSTGKDY